MQKACFYGNKWLCLIQLPHVSRLWKELETSNQVLQLPQCFDTINSSQDILLDILLTRSVKHALEPFMKSKELNGEGSYLCSMSERKVQVSKSLTLDTSPKVFILILKCLRFDKQQNCEACAVSVLSQHESLYVSAKWHTAVIWSLCCAVLCWVHLSHWVLPILCQSWK